MENHGGISALRDWLETNPDDASVMFILANALLSQGESRAALHYYERLLKTQPDNAVILNNVAWLYLEQNPSDALQYAERAYRLAPEQPKIIDTYGWTLVQQGQTQRGLVLLQQAVSQAPHEAEIRYHLVQAMRGAGQRQEAAKELKRLVRDYPEFPQFEEAQALLQKWQGK